MSPHTIFTICTVVTACVFIATGALKGFILRMSMLRSALETLSVGGLAAVIAYVVENVLGGLLLYNFLRLNTD